MFLRPLVRELGQPSHLLFPRISLAMNVEFKSPLSMNMSKMGNSHFLPSFAFFLPSPRRRRRLLVLPPP